MSDHTPSGTEPTEAPETGAQTGPGDAPERSPWQPIRNVPPILYPVLALIFGGALVFSFSRVLLAVGKTPAAIIALVMALNILLGAALVAYGRRVRRRPAAFPLLVGAAVMVIAAGGVGIAVGERGTKEGEPPKGPQGQTVHLAAQNIQFQPTELSFTAGSGVSLVFENKDAGTPHNFALFKGTDATGPKIFGGSLVTGPTTTTYSFKAPPPGTYFFHCDVHPAQMTGTATVAPGGGGPGPGGGGGVTVTAKNIAFSPKEVAAPPGGQITIHFDNRDAGTPHNIEVFDGADATAPSLCKGELVTGPAKADYTFEAPPPGTYFFHCDVHPTQMTGTLIVK
jgi:plastocyanin